LRRNVEWIHFADAGNRGSPGAVTVTRAPAPSCDLPWARIGAARDVRASGRVLRAVGEVGVLAHGHAPLRTRAEAALEAVATFAPADGAVLDAWNPALSRHEPLAFRDVPADVLAFEASNRFLRDPGYRYVRARRTPHRRCDVPGAERNALIADVCEPAGYREGVTACLFNGGRYTGMLNLGFVDERPLEPSRMVILTVALESLGRLVDLTQSSAVAEAALPPDTPAVVMHADGRSEAVLGRPHSPLLDAGTPSLRAARHYAPRKQGTTAFLWAQDREVWRLLVLRLGAAGAAGTLLVTVQPATTTLSIRELEVLTRIVQGLPNPTIAAQLGISAHTVARHVEHILEKLGVAGRVEAAACAVREGLVLAEE
jgi:DNA-binding CsgD family transcriptional regulator